MEAIHGSPSPLGVAGTVLSHAAWPRHSADACSRVICTVGCRSKPLVSGTPGRSVRSRCGSCRMLSAIPSQQGPKQKEKNDKGLSQNH